MPTPSSTRKKALAGKSRPALRQSSLSFLSKRNGSGSADVKGKGKEIPPSDSGTATPTRHRNTKTSSRTTRTALRLRDADDEIEDEEEVAKRAYFEGGPGESDSSAVESDDGGDDVWDEIEEDDEEEDRPPARPAKKRRVGGQQDDEIEDRPEEGSSPARKKGIFRSRVSIENTSGGPSRSATTEAKPAKGKAKEVNLPKVTEGESQQEVVKEHLDPTDKKGRWRKHYGEVQAKMGYMPPSGYFISC